MGPNLRSLPNSTDVIHVVEGYKHLGRIITSERALKADAALSSFVPIALRVFGSTKMDLELNEMFIWLMAACCTMHMLLSILAPACGRGWRLSCVSFDLPLPAAMLGAPVRFKAVKALVAHRCKPTVVQADQLGASQRVRRKRPHLET